MEAIMEIFSEAQRSAASHKSGSKKLLAMLGSDPRGDYLKFLLHGCIDKLLMVVKSSAYVDRVTEFTFKMISSMDDDMFQKAMTHIASRLSSSSKSVRQRCCLIIDGVLTQMTEKNVDLSLEVCADLSKHLLKRLNDKLPTIRQLAVKCLKSLQDPSDPFDPCTEGLVNVMLNDSSHVVRAEAVSCVVLFEGNVPQLCSRLRDVKSEVRLTTLLRLSEIDLRMIKNKAKPEVVKLCLTDRDEQVRLNGIKVIMRWLEKMCSNCTIAEAIPKFLGLMNPIQYEEVVLLLGATIVEELLRNDVQQVYPVEWKDAVKEKTNVWNKSINSISMNDILWIYVRCNFARRNCPVLLATDICNNILPSVDKITELLSEARQQLDADVSDKKVFVLKYLLRLTTLLGKSDAKLLNECETLLSDLRLPVDLVEPILKALAGLYTNNTRFTFSESVLMSINEMKEQSIALAEVDEEQSMAYTERALQISYLLLQKEVGNGNKASEETLQEGATSLSDTIHQFQDLLPFITDCLVKPFTGIRTLAVGCLGLLCLWSATVCGNYKRVILQVIGSAFEQVIVRGQALKCVVDMACIHKDMFIDDAELCSALIRAQDSDESELVLLAAESSAKLLFAGVISEPSLFANLLKFFFLSDLLPQENSDEVEGEEQGSSSSNARLQQILSIFLQAYLVSEGRSEEVIVGSISQLVADITLNVKHSGTKVTTLNNVLKHLLTLCDNIPAASTESTKIPVKNLIKERAMAAISREVLKLGNSRVDKSIVKEYVKVLNSFPVQEWLTPDKAFTVQQVLQTLLDSVILDKTSQKTLQGFVKDCSKMNKSTEHSSAGYQLMSSVPGLADLVALAAKQDPFDQEDSDAEDEEAEVVVKPSRSQRATKSVSKKSVKKVVESDEDEAADDSQEDSGESDGDNDDDDEGDIEESENEEVNVKVSGRSGPSRSRKANASKKISKQLAE